MSPASVSRGGGGGGVGGGGGGGGGLIELLARSRIAVAAKSGRPSVHLSWSLCRLTDRPRRCARARDYLAKDDFSRRTELQRHVAPTLEGSSGLRGCAGSAL